MATEATLFRIGGLHLFLVAALAIALVGRAGSVLVGGGAIGGAMLAYWGIARGLRVGVSRVWLIVLAVLKVTGYLALVTAGLVGALPVDAVAFAVGVTCFPAAVVVGSLVAGARWRTVG